MKPLEVRAKRHLYLWCVDCERAVYAWPPDAPVTVADIGAAEQAHATVHLVQAHAAAGGRRG